MDTFVRHLELDGGLAVTTWDDDAPAIGFQVNAFNWRLRRAREAKGWSRAELARQCGTQPGVVGDAERLRRVSAQARERIALALGVPEDVLFPGEVDALPQDGPAQIELSLTREDVRSLTEPDAHAEMVAGAERQSLRAQLLGAIETLTEREQRVVRTRFGLDDGVPRTFDEVGGIEGVTREGIRQIEAKALRKLRHPQHTRGLWSYVQEYAPLPPTPKAGECQRRDTAGTCLDRFQVPGWMRVARGKDLKRPMFLCEPCWSLFLRARAGAEAV